MGAALFLEYEDVLARDNLFARARLNFAERQLLFNVFVSKCDRCAVYFRWRPNLRDEGDSHLVELAVAGNAAYIVTSNERDFRNQNLRFDHIGIISPDAFLQGVGSMNAITFQGPGEVHEKMEEIAAEKGVSLPELLASVTNSIIVEHDAEIRFRKRAEGGAGLEGEALSLLRQ
jgi:predicted nucleic acid-binding protein